MDAGLCPESQYQGQNDGADNDDNHQQGHDQLIQCCQRRGGALVGFVVRLNDKGLPVNLRQGLYIGHHPRHVLRVIYGDIERGKSVVNSSAVHLFCGLNIYKNPVLDHVVGCDHFPKPLHRIRGKQPDDLHFNFWSGKVLIFCTVAMSCEIVSDVQFVSLCQVPADDCRVDIIGEDVPPF